MPTATRLDFLLDGLVHTHQPSDSCPVCQEAHNEPVALTACGHIFCKPCILEWCSRLALGSCPCCRTQLWTQHDPVPTIILDDEETRGLLVQIAQLARYPEQILEEVRASMSELGTPVASSDVVWALARATAVLTQYQPINDHQEVMLLSIPCLTRMQAMAELLPLWYESRTGYALTPQERLEWLHIVALIDDVLRNDWPGLIGTHFELGHRLEAIVNDNARVKSVLSTTVYQGLWTSDWFRDDDDHEDGFSPAFWQVAQRRMFERLIEHIFRSAKPVAAMYPEEVAEGWRWT